MRPSLPNPQHAKLPPSVTTQTWVLPTDICLARAGLPASSGKEMKPASDTGSSSPMCWLLPYPRPNVPPPQHTTEPSSMIAQEIDPPQLMALALLLPLSPGVVGSETNSKVLAVIGELSPTAAGVLDPRPSWPTLLEPQQVTFPSTVNAQLWEEPAHTCAAAAPPGSCTVLSSHGPGEYSEGTELAPTAAVDPRPKRP